MKVCELIAALQKVENQELEVAIRDEEYYDYNIVQAVKISNGMTFKYAVAAQGEFTVQDVCEISSYPQDRP